MTLYEPKWSAPGDGTNTEPGEYEAWLEFKALVEAGHLVPVEPDYEAGAKEIGRLVYVQLADIGYQTAARHIVKAALGIGETP